MKKRSKKVICTSFSVDVLGPPKAGLREIRRIEKTLWDAVRRAFKVKGFSLRLAR